MRTIIPPLAVWRGHLPSSVLVCPLCVFGQLFPAFVCASCVSDSGVLQAASSSEVRVDRAGFSSGTSVLGIAPCRAGTPPTLRSVCLGLNGGAGSERLVRWLSIRSSNVRIRLCLGVTAAVRRAWLYCSNFCSKYGHSG